MENEYYTPDIEDIHVGYEYEWSHNGIDWFISTLQTIPGGYDVEECSLYLGRCVLSIHEMLECKLIRTLYLTKEQIESEGWTIGNTGGLECGCVNGICMFSKRPWTLGYNFKNKCMKISTLGDSSDIRYEGECKSINEFRTIIKLLKIN